MNNKHLGIGAVVLIIILGLYFLTTNSPTNQNLTDDTTIATSSTEEVTIDKPNSEPSIDNINPNDIELDFSKLQGKDRLYTEEEGRYENLSEEEKRMMQKFICLLYKKIYCLNETNLTLRLISLKDGVAIVYEPATEGYKYGISIFYIYDIHSNTYAKDRNQGDRNHGRYAFGSDVIVKQSLGTSYVGDINHKYRFNNHNYNSGSVLMMYRPGMDSFVEIPDSYLNSSFTNLKWEGVTLRSLPVIFEGDTIIVYVFSYECDETLVSEFAEEPINCKNILKETKTFDLSNLP